MSRVHEVVLAGRRINEAQLRIKEQKARLQHMIVQGFPSQSADDLLSNVNLNKLQKGRQGQSPANDVRSPRPDGANDLI